MRFQIYSGETMIGQSDLDKLDPSMGIASGDFLPSESYKNVQPILHLYVEATANTIDRDSEMLDRYYQERDNLYLSVKVPNGGTVPVQWVHIEDFSEELDEIAITVVARDHQVFGQYFEHNEVSVV